MKSIQRIMGSLALTFLMLLTFQNCGQPGSLKLSSDGVASSKVTNSGGPGLIVGPIPTPSAEPATQPPASAQETPPASAQETPPASAQVIPPVSTDGPLPTPLQCDLMSVSAVSLNIKEVKAPSASGASSHLFEIVTNDIAQGSLHTIKIRALHTARKIDKIDLELAANGSLMMTGNQSTVLGVSTPAGGHKLRLLLDRQDYSVTKGQIYNLNFKVESSHQVVKNSCEAKKHDDDDEDENDADHDSDVRGLASSPQAKAKMSSQKEEQGEHNETDDDDDDDDDDSESKTCVAKADECRLFLNLTNGSLSAAQ